MKDLLKAFIVVGILFSAAFILVLMAWIGSRPVFKSRTRSKKHRQRVYTWNRQHQSRVSREKSSKKQRSGVQ